jgi:hypothetical protein
MLSRFLSRQENRLRGFDTERETWARFITALSHLRSSPGSERSVQPLRCARCTTPTCSSMSQLPAPALK